MSETHNRQLRDKANLLPIENFRNTGLGVMQVAPSNAVDAWANTPHRQELLTVLRNIAAETMDSADAVEKADR